MRSDGQNSKKDGATHGAKLSREQLLDPLCELAFPPSGEFSGTGPIISRGQVDQMQMPDGWLGTSKNRGENVDSYLEFHPPDAPEAMIVLYNPGTRLPESTAESLRNILNQPPHDLTAAELASLREVIDEKMNPNDFEIKIAQTRDHNGKRILVIEGTYLQIREETISTYIDTRGDGTFVEEIFFQAPTSVFSEYAPAVRNALLSIIWH